jgi:hypothetical protein
LCGFEKDVSTFIFREISHKQDLCGKGGRWIFFAMISGFEKNFFNAAGKHNCAVIVKNFLQDFFHRMAGDKNKIRSF